MARGGVIVTAVNFAPDAKVVAPFIWRESKGLPVGTVDCCFRLWTQSRIDQLFALVPGSPLLWQRRPGRSWGHNRAVAEPSNAVHVAAVRVPGQQERGVSAKEVTKRHQEQQDQERQEQQEQQEQGQEQGQGQGQQQQRRRTIT